MTDAASTAAPQQVAKVLLVEDSLPNGDMLLAASSAGALQCAALPMAQAALPCRHRKCRT